MDFVNWNEIEYQVAVERQLDLVAQRIRDEIQDTVVFCYHPPIVTLGRGSTPSDIIGWQGEILETSRGGKATYHGPNQLVAYPIVKLKQPETNLDLHLFFNKLENAVISSLSEFSVQAISGEDLLNKEPDKQYRGVWVGAKKIAAIGVAIKNWVTYHGVAINLYEDPQAFQGIRPCGFSVDQVTSLEKELGQKIDRKVFAEIFKQALENHF